MSSWMLGSAESISRYMSLPYSLRILSAMTTALRSPIPWVHSCTVWRYYRETSRGRRLTAPPQHSCTAHCEVSP